MKKPTTKRPVKKGAKPATDRHLSRRQKELAHKALESAAAELRDAATLEATGTPLENDRWELFCQAYLVRPIASRAYLVAYPGCTVETAYANGVRLLGNAKVAERIAELRVVAAERAVSKAEDVIRELERLAYSDLSDYLRWTPFGVYLKDGAEIPPELMGVVAEMSSTAYGVKVKLHPKQPALETLAKVHKIVEEKPTDRVFVIEMPPPATREEWDKRFGPGREWSPPPQPVASK